MFVRHAYARYCRNIDCRSERRYASSARQPRSQLPDKCTKRQADLLHAKCANLPENTVRLPFRTSNTLFGQTEDVVQRW